MNGDCLNQPENKIADTVAITVLAQRTVARVLQCIGHAETFDSSAPGKQNDVAPPPPNDSNAAYEIQRTVFFTSRLRLEDLPSHGLLSYTR